MDLLFTRQVRGESHYPTNSHRRLIINSTPPGTGCCSPRPKLPVEKRPSCNCDNPQQRRCVGLSSGAAQQRSRRQHKRLVSHAEMRLCLRSGFKLVLREIKEPQIPQSNQTHRLNSSTLFREDEEKRRCINEKQVVFVWFTPVLKKLPVFNEILA